MWASRPEADDGCTGAADTAVAIQERRRSMIEQPVASGAEPRLLRGGPIATAIREQVAADVAAFREEHGYAPALAVVVVGKDAPSAVYLHKILDGCRLVGIEDRLVELPEDAGEADIADALREPAAPTRTWPGIITQMPLPQGDPAAGRDRRPGPAARHRRHPPAQRRASSRSATTGSCRRRPTPASRSC